MFFTQIFVVRFGEYNGFSVLHSDFLENFGKLKTEWLQEHAASGNEQIKAVNDLRLNQGFCRLRSSHLV